MSPFGKRGEAVKIKKAFVNILDEAKGACLTIEHRKRLQKWGDDSTDGIGLTNCCLRRVADQQYGNVLVISNLDLEMNKIISSVDKSHLDKFCWLTLSCRFLRAC